MTAQTLTAESLTSKASDSPRPRTTRLLELNAETLRRNFNRRGFLTGHRLADHPLFELPRLLEPRSGCRLKMFATIQAKFRSRRACIAARTTGCQSKKPSGRLRIVIRGWC